MPLKTPVVLIVFNRPHLTEKVFAAIASAKPEKLFIAADGPRSSEEFAKCQAVRSIVEQVDWNCEVVRNMADTNLGCRKRIVSCLNWAFSQVNEAIILEDDCLPHSSFFKYCEALLDKYRHDERVLAIGGSKYRDIYRDNTYSYYFSKYSHTWGWATWKRAWQYFDESIPVWPQLKRSAQWMQMCPSQYERDYWSPIYDMIYEGRLKTSWDYQWQLAQWYHNGLCIVPNVNLVSNIGFGKDATHTRWKLSSMAQVSTHEIGTLSHPPTVVRNQEADAYTFANIYRGGILRRTYREARKMYRTLMSCLTAL